MNVREGARLTAQMTAEERARLVWRWITTCVNRGIRSRWD